MSKTTTSIRSNTRLGAALLAVSAAFFLGGCATKGVAPVAELATARSSITQAEAAGAGNLSPVELLSARDKLVRAEAAVGAEQFSQARRFAAEAAVDAELAERKARAERARKAATELERANAVLEREITKVPAR
jgi:hypothetical protein